MQRCWHGIGKSWSELPAPYTTLLRLRLSQRSRRYRYAFARRQSRSTIRGRPPQQLGGFDHRQAHVEAQLHHLAEPLVEAAQLSQRLVQREEVIGRRLDPADALVEAETAPVAPPLDRVPAPGASVALSAGGPELRISRIGGGATRARLEKARSGENQGREATGPRLVRDGHARYEGSKTAELLKVANRRLLAHSTGAGGAAGTPPLPGATY